MVRAVIQYFINTTISLFSRGIAGLRYIINAITSGVSAIAHFIIALIQDAYNLVARGIMAIVHGASHIAYSVVHLARLFRLGVHHSAHTLVQSIGWALFKAMDLLTWVFDAIYGCASMLLNGGKTLVLGLIRAPLYVCNLTVSFLDHVCVFLGNVIIRSFQRIHSFFSALFERIGSFVITFFKAIGFLVVTIIRIPLDIWNFTTTFLSRTGSLVANFFRQCALYIHTAAITLFNGISSIIRSILSIPLYVWNATCTLLKTVYSSLVSLASRVAQLTYLLITTTRDGIGFILKSILSIPPLVWNAMLTVLSAVYARLAAICTRIKDYSFSFAIAAFTGIRYVIERLLNVPVRLFSFLANLATNAWQLLAATADRCGRACGLAIAALFNGALYILRIPLHVWNYCTLLAQQAYITISKGFALITRFIVSGVTTSLKWIRSVLSSAADGITFVAHATARTAIYFAVTLPRHVASLIFAGLCSSLTRLRGFLTTGHSALKTGASATRQALAGSAGFIFISIPRGAWFTLNGMMSALSSSISDLFITAGSWLVSAAHVLGQLLWNIPRRILGTLQTFANRGADHLRQALHFLVTTLPIMIFQVTSKFLSSTRRSAPHVFYTAGRVIDRFMFGIPHTALNIAKQGLTTFVRSVSPHLMLVATVTTRGVIQLFHGTIKSTNFLLFTLPGILLDKALALCTITGTAALYALKLVRQGIYHSKQFILDVPANLMRGLTTAKDHTKNGLSSVGSHAKNGLAATHNAITPHLQQAHATTKKALILSGETAYHVLKNITQGLAWGTQRVLDLPFALVRALDLMRRHIMNGLTTAAAHTKKGVTSVGSHAKAHLVATHNAITPRIKRVHTATSTAIGYFLTRVFVTTPRVILSSIRRAGATLLSWVAWFYTGIKYIVRTAGQFVFLTTPQTLWKATKFAHRRVKTGVKTTKNFVAPKFITAHKVTKKALSGTAGFLFLDIPRGFLYSVRALALRLEVGALAIYSGLTAGLFVARTLLFVHIPTALLTALRISASTLLHALTSFMMFTQRIVRRLADGVIVVLKLINTCSNLVKQGARILLESLLSTPHHIAQKALRLAAALWFLAGATRQNLIALWKDVCAIAEAPRLALGHLFDRGIAGVHGAHQTSVHVVYRERPTIQAYAFFGTGIYLMLVLFSTYAINRRAPSIEPVVARNNVHSHATPITVDLEVHTLKPAPTGLGNLALEGILSYSYNTGTEPASSVDDFTISHAQNYSLRKLGTNISHNHITTTRHAFSAILKPDTANTTAFPFSGSRSSFTIHNNRLSSREIHYQALQRPLHAESASALGLQRVIMEPRENNTHARSGSALAPELTVTLEYQRWSPLVLFGFYILLIALMLAAIGSLIVPQPLRLRISGATLCALGLVWVVCYMSGMLLTVSHLMVTLLLGLALNTLVVAINTANRSNKDAETTNQRYATDQFQGQTRWVLVLLSMVALVLTMLIKI